MRRPHELQPFARAAKATALHLVLEGIRDELISLGHDEEEVAGTEILELFELRRLAYEDLMSAPGT